MSDRPSDTLLAWAAVGSRISGFHHDSASKLQSLMMAIDEASDLLGGGNSDVERALQTASGALRELHALLSENRALAKAPQRKPVSLAEVMTRAAARHGVKLRGDLPAATVHVATASIVHALSLLFDQCAGALQGVRGVDVAVTAASDRITLRVTGPAAPDPDVVVVATFLLEREDGGLELIEGGFVAQLATQAPAPAAKP